MSDWESLSSTYIHYKGQNSPNMFKIKNHA